MNEETWKSVYAAELQRLAPRLSKAEAENEAKYQWDHEGSDNDPEDWAAKVAPAYN